ncbi:MAG: virulence protein SciE type [Deltaproteobacteria bacterium]|nr:MAG: virulence protein SciE type [Deltaproteobacteria bacterium]
MKAEEHLQAGNLKEALAALTDEIRSNPSKAELRIFMFQLLSVMGQWERAMTQLNVAAEMDAENLMMATVYRAALNCEALRADVFQGKRTPMIFGEPLEWVGWLTQIPGLLAAGKTDAAAELRDRAFEAAPAIAGKIDDAPFEWLADADTRLGPLLEAIVDGKYYWIPFERIQELRIEKPANLRDVIWTPAAFTWSNAGQAAGLIPSRYIGSENASDNALRLGRKTDWQDAGSDFFLGLGQRMLATDQGEFPLFEVREIQFTTGDT